MKQTTEQFIDKYDLLSKQFADPVEVLFNMMVDEDIDHTTRKACASDLISYRFPKQKSVDINAVIDSNSNGLTFIFAPAATNNMAIVPAAEEFARFPLNDNRLVEYLASDG